MSKIKLTPQQSEAITNKGGALLISASAGSGKTKVLVERLLTEVMTGRCDVDDFLIITFTNAAAAELRGRILGAVSDMLSQDPTNAHLRRQLDLCCRAHIETIHSFCTSVIRENAHICGISPEFRIADETESEELRLESLNEILEELYESENEEFLALADTMGAGRNDSKLIDIVLDLYGKLMSHPYPHKWAEQQINAYDINEDTDAADTVWGSFIINKMTRYAQYQLDLCNNLLAKINNEPDFAPAYAPSVEAMACGLVSFIDSAQHGWNSARAASVIDCPGAKPKKGYEDLKKERTTIKDNCKKIAAAFTDSSEKLISDMLAVKPSIEALFNVVTLFVKRYDEKKKKRGVIDFADQEHLALQILVDAESGGASQIAKELSERFTQIMVDEYQDVNSVQDMIFSAVSRGGKNVFMVGDVKQSIYRFRLADPTIFLKKYLSYKDYSEAEEGEGRYIILAENFRSRKGIIDSVNYIFRNIMSEEFGEMNYTAKEELICGANYPDNEEQSIEFDVIETVSAAENDNPLPEKRDIEAMFVAKRIKEIVGKMMISDGNDGLRPVKYGDIAILMRSLKGKVEKYMYALTEAGIPAATDSSTDFFANIEVSVAVSLLTVIDNPHQDIPLLALLRSPIYGFTSEELAVIRSSHQGGDFYTALEFAAESNDKCRKFIDELDSFRAAAPDMSVSELFSFVAEKTGLFAVASAMHNGIRRRTNLMMLFEYAKTFESGGYKGLFGFVQYLRRLMEAGESISSDDTSENENTVRVMSIHKSKGMEFPVVFLVDTAKRLNTSDSTAPLVIHPKLGIGAKMVDINRRIEYPTLSRVAVQQKILEEGMAEELRVLYVAMTRAKEKLIITLPLSDVEKEFDKYIDSPVPVPPQRLADERSVSKWILLSALRREEFKRIYPSRLASFIDAGDEKWDVNLIEAADLFENMSSHVITEETESIIGEEDFEFESKLSFKYPFNDVLYVPSKITATELNGGIKEAESAENAISLAKTGSFDTFTPAFMEDGKKMTAAEKGTAAHTVMQFANFSECVTKDLAAAEIERLRSFGIISDEQAKAVNPSVISGFFDSDIGKRILNADNVWREFKFSILAKSLEVGYPGNEEILLQGVIDCCIEEDGELVIVDYKTDYVTDETLKSKADFYSGQLNAYGMAMERILKKPVKEKILYFLSAGKSVIIK